MIDTSEIAGYAGPYVRSIFRFLTLCLVAPGGITTFLFSCIPGIIENIRSGLPASSAVSCNSSLLFQARTRNHLLILGLFTASAWTGNLPGGINAGGTLAGAIIALALLSEISRFSAGSVVFYIAAAMSNYHVPQPMCLITTAGASLCISGLVNRPPCREEQKKDPAHETDSDFMLRSAAVFLLSSCLARTIAEQMPLTFRPFVFPSSLTLIFSAALFNFPRINKNIGPLLLCLGGLVTVIWSALRL